MSIYEQLIQTLHNRINDVVTPAEVKSMLQDEYGTNPASVILSDYCYNRYNNGIAFNKHLFEYITRSSYKYLGENVTYTGFIFHKPKGCDRESIIGEWVSGVKTLREKNLTDIPLEKQAEFY
ncbi:DUF7225 domain-containing protein [Niallia sp. 01092]|uniref:DUF7225 domain-containing protein n=1 Tax=unclassified Niallia TaxID=2837522 RepID=UPI003FD62780